MPSFLYWSNRRQLLWLLAVALVACPCQAQQEKIFYESQVQQILISKCGNCHNSQKRKSGLDLTSYTGARRGGESGKPAVADSIEESLLWQKIDQSEMPPKGQPQLTAEQTEAIRSWLLSGAASKQQQTVTQHDILPYLYTRCVVCHGKRRQEAGLDLRTVKSILKGGKSGPAIIAGKPEESLLLKRVSDKDMPPPKELIRAGVRPLERLITDN